MRFPSFLVLGACVLGCGPSASLPMTLHDGGVDAGPSPDLTAQPDLVPFGFRYHFVVDKFVFPQQRSDYAYDLNGDAFPDNQFGNVVRAFSVQGLQLQAADQQAIVGGDALELVALFTRDSALLSDPGAVATLDVAAPRHPPDLFGSGSFTIDPSVPPSPLPGAVSAGTFTSADPTRLPSPPTAVLRLVLAGGPAVDLPLVGAHVTFTPSSTLSSSCKPLCLDKGQLNGALARQDIDNVLVPALAAGLTAVENRMPCDADCMKVQAVFDTNHDGQVSTAEVSQGQVLGKYLVPDVQLYNSAGQWMPSPANLIKDSWSIGVGFTAVSAMFNE
jgi:hypothetical protein